MVDAQRARWTTRTHAQREKARANARENVTLCTATAREFTRGAGVRVGEGRGESEREWERKEKLWAPIQRTGSEREGGGEREDQRRRTYTTHTHIRNQPLTVFLSLSLSHTHAHAHTVFILFQIEFLEKLKALVRPGGPIIHNTWGTLDKRYGQHLATYSSKFKNVFVGDSPSLANKIVVAWDGDKVGELDVSAHTGKIKALGLADSVINNLAKWGNAAKFARPEPEGIMKGKEAAKDRDENVRCGCEGSACKSLALS